MVQIAHSILQNLPVNFKVARFVFENYELTFYWLSESQNSDVLFDSLPCKQKNRDIYIENLKVSEKDIQNVLLNEL